MGNIKPSLLLDLDYSLFAERKFQLRDIFSIYLGKVPTEYTDSNYKLEWGMSESKGRNQSTVAKKSGESSNCSDSGNSGKKGSSKSGKRESSNSGKRESGKNVQETNPTRSWWGWISQ